MPKVTTDRMPMNAKVRERHKAHLNGGGVVGTGHQHGILSAFKASKGNRFFIVLTKASLYEWPGQEVVISLA